MAIIVRNSLLSENIFIRFLKDENCYARFKKNAKIIKGYGAIMEDDFGEEICKKWYKSKYYSK